MNGLGFSLERSFGSGCTGGGYRVQRRDEAQRRKEGVGAWQGLWGSSCPMGVGGAGEGEQVVPRVAAEWGSGDLGTV